MRAVGLSGNPGMAQETQAQPGTMKFVVWVLWPAL